MRQKLLSLFILLILGFVGLEGRGQVSMSTTGSVSQDFNTLISSGTGTWTNNSTISNWYAQKGSSVGNVSIKADDGSTTNGGLYSYGNNSTDRALGSLVSNSTGAFAYGIQLKNASTSIITSLKISYKFEQWRNGGNTTTQYLKFYYKKSNSEISDLNPDVNTDWIAVSDLNGTTLINTSGAAKLDGNLSANSTLYSNIESPLKSQKLIFE